MARYQVMVIGSGPGGYVAAIRAAQLGFKTICIEKMATLGGTCLNVGCIPSKALLQSTEYYELLNKMGREHGIEAKELAFNFRQMMDRKDLIVKGLVDSIGSLFKKNMIESIHGEARFINSHTVEIVKEKETCIHEADHIILATGSEPIPFSFLPFNKKNVVSSTGALSLPSIPKTLIVVGAGIIGVELASVYNRLGARVVIIEMLDRATPGMDQAISKQLLQILQKQGMEFHFETKVTGAALEESRVILSIESDNKQLSLEGEVVLVAIGRRPYTNGLNVEAAGISLTSKGTVEVDANFRTSQPHLFAIGDLIDGPMLAHRASHEGIAVAEIIAGLSPHLNYMSIPNVVYTHPEAAGVGLTESEARAAGLSLKIGTSFFRGNPRARCSGEVDGFVKIIGEAVTGRVIGVHILSSHASEIITEGVIAIEKQATLDDIAHAPHAHPTLAEAIMEAAQNAIGHAIHT